jgi:hypothetical protein
VIQLEDKKEGLNEVLQTYIYATGVSEKIPPTHPRVSLCSGCSVTLLLSFLVTNRDLLTLVLLLYMTLLQCVKELLMLLILLMNIHE